MGHLHEAFAAAHPAREAQAAAADCCMRRAADRIDPPPVLSRADQIIAEGHERRIAYRKLTPGADTAMVYGVQIGYLQGQVRRLADELDRFNVTRNPLLCYRDAETDIGTVTVGYAYIPEQDEGDLILSAEVEVQEVWCNGVDVHAWVPGDVLDKLGDDVLEAHEAVLSAEARSFL